MITDTLVELGADNDGFLTDTCPTPDNNKITTDHMPTAAGVSLGE